MPDLPFSLDRVAFRKGRYARGIEGYDLVLRTALSVLVDHGYREMTLRRIAAECGLKAGNITYYFKTKSDLVRALLEAIAGGYERAIRAAVGEAGDDPEHKLRKLIRFILEDGTTKQSTYLFPELWSLANHDPFVKKCVEELYAGEHAHFDKIIAELNPALGDDERKLVTSFILSSLEGIGVFAGYGKIWQDSMPQLQDMACDNFVRFAKNMKSGGTHETKRDGE